LETVTLTGGAASWEREREGLKETLKDAVAKLDLSRSRKI
jgi:hypothetical protein